jgi:hypothetical protein
VSTPEGVRAYFEDAFTRTRASKLTAREVRILSGRVVLIAGIDTIDVVVNDVLVARPGRITFVIAETEAGWKIVNFHRSVMPP